MYILYKAQYSLHIYEHNVLLHINHILLVPGVEYAWLFLTFMWLTCQYVLVLFMLGFHISCKLMCLWCCDKICIWKNSYCNDIVNATHPLKIPKHEMCTRRLKNCSGL